MRSARRTGIALIFAILALLLTVMPVQSQYTYHAFLPITANAAQSMESHVGFSIVQPHATTNRDTNPSFELATTGWTLNLSATIARDTTAAKRGTASLKVTPSSTDNSGAYVTYSLTAQDYTWSADVLGAAGVSYEVHYANSSGTTLATIATFTGTGEWQRIEGTFTETGTNTRRIYIKKRGTGADPFWVDGVQLENLSYATTYCDGDQPGCLWTGGKHVSTSTRSAMYRGGGKKISLASLGVYLVSQQGTGMPTIENQRVSYAIKPGSYFQRSNVRERSITLVFSLAGDGVADWHYRRQILEDLIKPDLVTPEQPFRLFYDDGGREVYLDCHYEDGLQIADGTRDIEAIPLKCLSNDPFWRVDGNNATALTMQSTFTGNYLIKRSPQGVWSILSGNDANNVISAMDVGQDGKVYIGGSFTSLNSVSSTGTFGYYDPVDGLYHALGSYPGTGTIYDVTVGPNNEVYVIANNIYKWTGSAWTNLTSGGAPTASPAYSIVVGKDGNVYVAGEFTNINSVAITAFAKWNGSAWSSVSFPGDHAFYATTDAAGNVYVAGSLTGTHYVWKYDGSNWTRIGDAFDNYVYHLECTPGGQIYAAGAFTTVNGGATANYVAVSNGSNWKALGSGLAGAIQAVGNTSQAMDVDPSGRIAIGSGNSLTDNKTVYLWNGSSFLPADVILPVGSRIVDALAYAQDGTLYLGFNGTGTVTATGITTVTNSGSATAYPTIKVSGPSSGTAVLYRIANITTGKNINLNYTLLPGEVLTLKTSPSLTQISSSYRRAVPNAILPASNASDFGLLSGSNSIAVFTDSSSVTGTIEWPETGWSIDTSGT